MKKIPIEILQKVTPDQAWHYKLIPYADNSGVLHCYTENKNGHETLSEELEVILGQSVKLEILSEGLIKKALSEYYRKDDFNQKNASFSTLDKHSQDFVLTLVNEAKNIGSSDIHLEPFEQNCRIRFRVDGRLIERYSLEKAEYPAIVNKIKVKSNLDIAEKRLPQDGRIFLKMNKSCKVDIRVSILPTLHGEKIVLRLLNNNPEKIELESLGFSKLDKQRYLEGIRKPHGMILISGPTGSGKTTTLYATLKLLNNADRNIQTIEDPVEYTLEGVNQSPLRENIGYDFASALRTFLRQDPDIIMVGEIRDKATAEMAVRASLTGHLVLSTIHTNSAWGIIPRIVNMGIPPYLVADTLNLAIAQRLVRCLCEMCKVQEPFTESLLPAGYDLAQKIEFHCMPVGCEDCHFTGYRKRIAIYEVIPVSDSLREKIKSLDFNVKEILEKNKINTLGQNAIQLFRSGQTSIEEVYPILASSKR